MDGAGAGAGAGNNEAACAVCRHLGKQCERNCILGPYFPQERIQEFKCVHRIFGIHNLTQIVSSVEENERPTTVQTLILEAQMRVHDMVHGSYGVEKTLRAQCTNAVKELNFVKQQLRFLRGGGGGGVGVAPPSSRDTELYPPNR